MNRLAAEQSPYLLQHAHNPVDWYAWGPEAFEKARRENKPIFLSIGYSTCHWCHVMERESFESAAVAEILNRDFVSIKVDREERPDVDSIYMTAVQVMTNHGGWPMSVFMTPDGRPFYAGTYFPPVDRHGLPSFTRVLGHVAQAYRTRRDEVEEAGNEIRNAIAHSQHMLQAAEVLDRHQLDEAAERIVRNYDPKNGGFGSAPKFPPSMTLDFLMQVAWRTNDARLLEVVTHTLTKMAFGGMYDQIGGGFHRYSVDAIWLVPHFEKMLYDNALLARVYTRAWQLTKDPLFVRIARETLDFVARELTSPDGGFYSTLDADSEGEEGKFYVWTPSQVREILGEEDGRAFCELFDITEGGNFEGHNIPHLASDPGDVEDAKRKLYAAREQRIRPGRDEKILSGWNGWMLAAFADAALAFDSDAYREITRRNADFLLARCSPRLLRHAKIPALLEDFSGVAWGLTLAYEATHDRRYLDAARSLMDDVLARFKDEENGGFFDTPTDHEQLITRPKDLFDNATPSGNSVACDVLLRLALLFGSEEYANEATEALRTVFPLAQKYPNGFGFLLGVAEWRAGAPKEIALTGSGETFNALRRVVGEEFRPHRVLVAGEGSADLPLMKDRPAERALAYVCEAYMCQEPTADPERLRALLRL
ncbi:MAG: thioredoxin domain-containing protein [Acidobacteria bacterium]|nr:thioredoxin domain-containing protein [Acidobacteriota bacterium]